MSVLTRYMIPLGSRLARPALASPQVLHATIMRAFTPEQHARFGDRRVLWRIDPSPSAHRLYIVSPEAPDLAHLERELGGDQSAGATFDYSSFLDTLRPATEWRFRLSANPTKAIRQPDGPSRRTGIIKESEQIDWLLSRAPSLGFHVPTNRLKVPEVIVRHAQKIGFRREERTVTLATVVYDGILAVDNPELLRSTLLNGIGRAKGYGHGLMTLAPTESR